MFVELDWLMLLALDVEGVGSSVPDSVDVGEPKPKPVENALLILDCRARCPRTRRFLR